ncbi:MAG: glycosyltransferase family 2 protein, partial [Clostridia bacterium]
MIDVLLATYNGEKYISQQIESILSQSYTDFRLLISDDKSTDNTVNIISDIMKMDSRISLFTQQENLGYVKNFEFLMGKVTNSYFMLSDQDDVWLPNKIEVSLDKIQKTNALLVYSDLLVVDEKLNVINTSFWKSNNLFDKITKYNCYEMLMLSNTVTGCTIMANSNLLKQSMPFPISKLVIHDYWLALMAMQKDAVAYIDTPLIKYRQHSNNQVGSGIKKEKFESFYDKRISFIDKKIQQISIYIQNKQKFTKNAQHLNDEFLDFLNAKLKVKYISLTKLGIFFKVYKCESFKTKFGN